jgi:outer membrane protein OmpA-like peptidoglycan-associated protein
VKQALVSGYGADAGRLEAKGFGASKPAAPNATPEGRAANRRVELVKR